MTLKEEFDDYMRTCFVTKTPTLVQRQEMELIFLAGVLVSLIMVTQGLAAPMLLEAEARRSELLAQKGLKPSRN